GHDGRDVLVVGGRTYEGQGDEVGPLLQAPAEIAFVLRRQRRHVHGHTGQVEAFVVRDRSGYLHAGGHARAGDVGDADGDPAVVDEDLVAGLDVLGQSLERGGNQILGAGNVLGGDGEGIALGQVVLALGEASEPDLRALQVHQHRHGAAGGLGGLPYSADHFGMGFLV